MSWCTYAEEHLLCVTLEDINSSCKLVAEQTEVNTCIPLLCSFPLSTIIYICKDSCSCCKGLLLTEYIVYESRTCVHHGKKECILADLVISNSAPAYAHLEILEPSYILHPRFIADAPCCSR